MIVDRDVNSWKTQPLLAVQQASFKQAGSEKLSIFRAQWLGNR